LEKDKINKDFKLVVIGGSAGSLEVILDMLPELSVALDLAIVIVLHRKNSGDSSLADLFAYKTALPVREIEDKDPIIPGMIHLAPPDYHLLFEKEGNFALDISEKINYSRPSIDLTFESAADVYTLSLTCLLLSGANADGVKGLREVKRKGGLIVVQNPATAISPFMPAEAISKLSVDLVLDPREMAGFINSL
jgi:two-component system chemotaxis response regulator CheB